MPDVPPDSARPRVALFVTCLADTIRPRLGFAALQLLEAAGCDVDVPHAQTCCGQPAFNSGDTRGGAALARRTVAAFEGYEHVVVPSGSCAGMIRAHCREALADDPAWLPRAEALAARTHELLSFLADVRGWRPEGVALAASATYHDSCSGLRELGIFAQPRALLRGVEGLEMRPLTGNDVCCGFGGTFCVKYPAISDAIVKEKAVLIEATAPSCCWGATWAAS